VKGNAMSVAIQGREVEVASSGSRGNGVEYRGLNKTFGSVHALRPLDLVIEPGEFFTILGPSGSGKSTLLMLTVGFAQPTAGDILVDGESIIDLPPHRRDFGVVFQHYALFPNMNVRKNVAFPLKQRRIPASERQRRVDEALALVEMTGLADRRISELSGGQQQRVALARALVFNPRLLLMDEPLSALDRRLRESMQLELQRIHRRLGVTVLYVTHDQGEALTLSDRIAVLKDGVVQQVATPRELYESPANSFVAGFLGDSNILSGRVTQVGARVQVQTDGGPSVWLSADHRRAYEPGDRVDVLVRPEAIRLNDPAVNGGDHCFAGTVREVIYMGEHTRYLVRAGDLTLICRQVNEPSAEVLRTGQTVGIAIDEGAARICGSPDGS
jgi:putative spermidine/putrescine transport system ATP-binding protein